MSGSALATVLMGEISALDHGAFGGGWGVRNNINILRFLALIMCEAHL
jgi:hypothetical protein